MKFSHIMSTMLWLGLLLIFSSRCVANETYYINPVSFNITVDSYDFLVKFAIYENDTQLYITFFSANCNLYGALFKVIDGTNDETVVPIYHTSVEMQNVETAVANIYPLSNGLYYFYTYLTGEHCNGQMTILGNTAQYGIEPCTNLFLSQTQDTLPPFTTDDNKFIVVSPPNCQWTAQTNDEWITITHDSLERGTYFVKYTVSKNPTREKKNGSILVRHKVFQVEQAGIPPFLPNIPLLLKKKGPNNMRPNITSR